jgi:hypothetical protein
MSISAREIFALRGSVEPGAGLLVIDASPQAMAASLVEPKFPTP